MAGFRTFRGRLAAVFLSLLIAVQAATILLVLNANRRNALRQIESSLETGAQLFNALTDQRMGDLAKEARLLAYDYGFKQAFGAADDPETLRSAMRNWRDRIGAGFFTLVSLDGRVLHDSEQPERDGAEFDLPEMIAAVSESAPDARGLVLRDGKLFAVVVVPLFAPDHAAWICMGFHIDDASAKNVEAVTGQQVSFVRLDDNRTVLASTFPPGQRATLSKELAGTQLPADHAAQLSVGGQRFVSLLSPLKVRHGTAAVLLQRDLDAELAPYRRLVKTLLAIAAAGLVLSAGTAIWIAGSVTRPVLQLAQDAHRVAQGDYTATSNPEPTRADEIGQLSRSFKKMTAGLAEREELAAKKAAAERTAIEAQAANTAKREFLAMISHEIRTPMNGIIGMTEQMLGGQLTTPQREQLELVKDSADSLLRLLNDLLDFSKIEAGKLELEQTSFGLRETLDAAVRILAPRAAARNLELALRVQPDVPDGLIGDPHRLRQIVLNLVGNALKFTERGKIAVRVESAGSADGGALVRFAVADTGVGIPPQARERIFRAFEQADVSTTRQYGGTGLGLAITSRLVSLMGGKLEVESEVGRGSTFFFTARFGVQAGVAASAAPAPEPVSRQRPLRILLAEDNLVNQRVAVAALESWGHRVAIVGDGAEAVEAVSREPFDLVLLDSQMPRLNGFEAIAEIRRRERNSSRRVPVIALTANVMPGFRDECLAAGMDAYVAKPIRREELLAAMAAAVPGLLAGAAAPIKENAPESASAAFDAAALLAGAGGDQGLMREMIELGCNSDAPRLLAELAAALEAGDPSAIERAAHGLKGLTGEFHAPAAKAAARALEEAASARQPLAVLRESAAVFEREFQRLTAALEKTRSA